MPAQKRSLSENLHSEDESAQHHNHHPKQSRLETQVDGEGEEEQPQLDEHKQEQNEDEDDDEEEEEDEEGEEEEAGEGEGGGEAEDSEGCPSSSSSEEKPEFVFVELPAIRKDVQCPICLGIIKKTRTVMECLHRFCRECIDKSMRMGNNECPACRTHCASRRSLRDDPNYDALIAALYPDIDKYEEEELAFHEEERNRNKQIQASIAQIFQRQSEALVKRRTFRKDSPGGFITRSQRNLRNAHSRRRRTSRGTEAQVSEDNEDDNNGGKDSSSTDERSTEVRQRRCKRRPGMRPSQPSSSVANSEGGCIGNDSEINREGRGISPGLAWSPEMLAWGRGGARSHTRHGTNSGCNSKSSRSSRLSKLVDYLRSLDENNDEVDVHLKLVSLDEQSTPSLQQPYLYCRPSVSVKHLRDFVAIHTPLQAEEVEVLAVRRHHNTNEHLSIMSQAVNGTQWPLVDPRQDELKTLEENETLGQLTVNWTSSKDHLILAYRRKETNGIIDQYGALA